MVQFLDLSQWLNFIRVSGITNPEDCLTVANSCLSKPYLYDFAKEYVNNGLITATGKWCETK